MFKKLLALSFTCSLAACAYNQQPVVDMTGVNQQEYDTDFAYCQSYAAKVDKGEAATTEAKNGALTGAAIGAVAGVLEDGLGGALVGAAAGGAIGAGAGAAEGANDATKTQSLVLRNCLANKGYTIYDLES